MNPTSIHELVPIKKAKTSTSQAKFKSGGFPLDLFLEVPQKDLICPICTEIFKDPCQCPFGHNFCDSCIKKSVSPNNEWFCPICQLTVMLDKIKKNYKLSNTIENLQIRCWKNMPKSNKTTKQTNSKFLVCSWEGKLNQLESHLRNECMLSLATCPNSNCTFKAVRYDLIANHLPNCEHEQILCKIPGCSEKYALKDEAHHLNICRFYQLKCPNNCGMEPVKSNDEIQNHIDFYCPLQPVLCPIYQLTNSSLCHNSITTTSSSSSSSSLSSVSICGCQYDGKILRQDVENHVNNPKTILVCLNELSSQKQILTHLELENQYLRNQLNFNNNV